MIARFTCEIGAFISAYKPPRGFTQTEWQFLKVDENDNVLELIPTYINSGTKTRYLRVNSIPGVQEGAYYRVKSRPIFGKEPGQWEKEYTLLWVTPASSPKESLKSEHAPVVVILHPNPNEGDEVQLFLKGLDAERILVKVVDQKGEAHYINEHFIEETAVLNIQFGNKLKEGMYNVEIYFADELVVENLEVKR
ncbi:MAG: hypothetical protein ACOYLH_10890 [Flavobacteriales bacterium]